VESFEEKGLKKAILYFGKGKTLVEVELQYSQLLSAKADSL
jgi:hypothetical protein